ncbi:hypothetical protein VTG60DRAFT_2756 [Thermothelomyces hinnuleus]
MNCLLFPSPSVKAAPSPFLSSTVQTKRTSRGRPDKWRCSIPVRAARSVWQGSWLPSARNSDRQFALTPPSATYFPAFPALALALFFLEALGLALALDFAFLNLRSLGLPSLALARFPSKTNCSGALIPPFSPPSAVPPPFKNRSFRACLFLLTGPAGLPVSFAAPNRPSSLLARPARVWASAVSLGT